MFYNQHAAYIEKSFYRKSVSDCQTGLGDYKETFFYLEKQSLRGRIEFPVCSPPEKPKPGSHPMASPLRRERGVCRECKETNQCTGFLIRSPIVPPGGSDSDLRAHRPTTPRTCCQVCMFSPHLLFRFQLQKADTTCFPSSCSSQTRRNTTEVMDFRLQLSPWPSAEYKYRNLYLSSICFTLERSPGHWPVTCATVMV